MLAIGTAAFGEVQYPIARPNRTNGIAPAAAQAAMNSHCPNENRTEAAIVATATTKAAEQSAKSAATTIRLVKRSHTGAGSVRRYRSHGKVRSTATPMPNWKSVTP